MQNYSAAERRQAIVRLLEAADKPLSAAALARQFSVSRQIIVGDVALLRAAGAEISATPRGYLYAGRGEEGVTHSVACIHTPEDMGRELYAIVDAGGEAVDVVVEHPVYGQLTGALHVRSRYEVEEFLRQLAGHDAKPLSELTGGVHLHTVRCPDEAVFRRVLDALEREGLLFHM